MVSAVYRFILMGIFLNLTFQTKGQSDSLIADILLIGDAGELTQGRQPVMDAIRQITQQSGKKASAAFFLGDNIYPTGLPAAGDRRFSKAKAILDTQWSAALQFAQQVYFIPGNHDWARGRAYGLDQIQRQAQYINELEKQGLKFLPENGCPGPEEIEIAEEVTAIVIDSQWWLQQNNRPGESSDCDCKTEDEVLYRLKDLLYKNRNKTVLFLSHHPFISSGIHGGYYQFKQHIFPLTEVNPNLYVPLPILGSIYPLVRGGIGNIQDIKHPIYRKMSASIDSLLAQHPACIRIAGHEHGLQFIEKGGQRYIVSGAGSKYTRHRESTDNHISFSTTGYVRLQIFTGGRYRLSIAEATADTHRNLLEKQWEHAFTASAGTVTEIPTRWPDSVTLAAAPYFKAGPFKRMLFGKNYREEWTTPVTVPVISISELSGGLQPTRRGGGMQSRSLRLEDSSGREYVLRSIEKYPDKTLPEELRQTFVKDAIVDGISASYPFAALSVPPLLQAAGIPHTKPRLVYLPDDPALQQYRQDFANKLYLFEARVPEELEKTHSTDKVIRALEKDNDNKIDQLAVLRARLVDMFIMDFDRHDDQWRWAAITEKEGKLYYPVPRDRDQAFFTNKGIIPWLVSRPWLIPKFQGFSYRAENIKRFNFNARYFDRSFLNRTNRDDWDRLAREVIESISDSIIDQALAAQPLAIRNQSAPSIAEYLKKRKDYLHKEAMQYQKFLHRHLDIAGSNKKDWFELNWKENGMLQLKIHDVNKAGGRGDKISEQLIDPAITRELRLYGLKGADVFRIKGNMPKGFTIRIISGEGADSLVTEQTGNRRSAIKWYDMPSENNKQSGNGLWQSKFSNKPDVHQYDRKSFKYDITAPLLLASYNRDDGILIGAGIKSTHHAFRKEPYAWQQQFAAYYAFATSAYQFRYAFDAPSFRFFANLKAPNNTRNFFGFGNQTKYNKSHGINITYYRARFSLFETGALAKWKPLQWMQLQAGPVFQRYWIDYDDNEGRFITKPESGLDQERLKQSKSFLGLQLQADIDTRNSTTLPTRGIHWINTARWVAGISSHSSNFSQWETALSYYWGFAGSNAWVLAGRIGGGANNGRFEFFQAQHLGGNESLRGYRNFRFAGDQRFFNNLDLRIRLTELRGYVLPGTVGLLLFQDIGRVWYESETSRRWHLGYGGGLWLAPANRVVVAACYGLSDEGGLPFVSLGFQF